MSQLPEEWNKIKLDCLLDFVIGGDWGKEPDFNHTDFENALCIRGTEFRHWSKEKGKTAVSRKVKSSSLAKRRLELGDIIIEISGGGPEQPVGRTVIIDEKAISIANGVPLVCTNFTRLARPSKEVDSAFLNYFLTFFYNSGEITKYQSGSNNLRNLQFQDYIQIGVPLAPLAEQTRIVEKLDEVLAQADTIKARLDGIPAILKRFRQSVLATAVSGKLTVDFKKREWQSKPLVDVCDFIVDCPHSTPEWSDDATGFFCVRTTAFNPFKLDMSSQGFVSESVYKERIKRLEPKKGDILYSREGTVGIACRIPSGYKLCLGQRMVQFRVNQEICPQYLEIVLNSEHILRIVKSLTIGSTVPRVNMKDIKKYPIPLPDRTEQIEIVRLVDQYFAFADIIEVQVKKAQARVDKLTQAILAKAFRGELTADWRAANPDLISGDNSAAALLARIQQERAAASDKKGKRGTSKARATA